jgi:hypothetical protein
MMNAARHVRVHGAEAGTLADRAHPAVCGAPVESLAVLSAQDRALVAFADGEVDRACCPRNQWDRGRLAALTEDLEGAVASLEAEILDIGGAGLADPQTVEAKQYGKGGVVTVVLLGGEQEHAQLGAVETAGIRRMDLGTAHVLGRVRGDAAIDVSEPVEAAHRRQSPVDRRCGKTSRLHPTAVPL